MNISDVCKKVSKDLGIEYQQVYEIAKFQFDFIAQVMKDELDEHDVLINNAFRFRLKNRFKHENNGNNKSICNNDRYRHTECEKDR